MSRGPMHGRAQSEQKKKPRPGMRLPRVASEKIVHHDERMSANAANAGALSSSTPGFKVSKGKSLCCSKSPDSASTTRGGARRAQGAFRTILPCRSHQFLYLESFPIGRVFLLFRSNFAIFAGFRNIQSESDFSKQNGDGRFRQIPRSGAARLLACE